MKLNILIVMILFLANLSWADTNTNVVVIVKETKEAKEVKEPYRYKRPFHKPKPYRDVLICKDGICRVKREWK